MGNVEKNTIVSSGTLNNADLLPTFLRVLRDEGGESAFDEYFCGLEGSPLGALLHYQTLEWNCLDEVRDAYLAGEECGWDMEALISALDDIGPEGCSFGSNEGDGACFGWWECGDE